MAKLTKKQKAILELVDTEKVYSLDEAVALLNKVPAAKFDEAFEVALNLGVDPRKSDQVVRGATVMPNGTGKDVRVAVFAQGANAEAATAAGADVVGFEDLAQSMKNGDLNYDVVIATPDAMRVVGQLGQILGPRGLMPNPRVGTVTPDVVTAVTNAKSGQVRFRTDKAGIIHAAIGRVTFDVDAIRGNIKALITELNRLKPASAKGVYLKKLTVATTMGPGIAVEIASV